MLKPKLKMSLPKQLGSDLVFDEYAKVYRDRLVNANGVEYPYYVLNVHGPSVFIIAETSDNKLVLTLEYRHPTKEVLLSCPGGFIEPGEDPITSAKRELLEEAGCTADEWHAIGSAYPYPGISSQKTYYVHARHAVLSHNTQLEKAEHIETYFVDRNDFYQWIKEGEPLDGNLCTALFFLGLFFR